MSRALHSVPRGVAVKVHHRTADDARRNELRTVFALFDVEGRGAISMGDVRSAVKRGGSGLSEADAGDWPKLAEALEAKIGAIAEGEIGFEAFARIVEGALRRDDEEET